MIFQVRCWIEPRLPISALNLSWCIPRYCSHRAFSIMCKAESVHKRLWPIRDVPAHHLRMDSDLVSSAAFPLGAQLRAPCHLREGVVVGHAE